MENPQGEKLMDVSVVVPTRNRSGYLRANLKSLERQAYPRDQLEVIVVDNDSTDDTEWAVKEASGEISFNVRRVVEKKIGLAHARNRGIEESKGEIIAFIDDDAGADPRWLATLERAFREHPDAGCVSGKVLLNWTEPPPSWWDPCFNGALSGFTWGDKPRPFAYPYCPVGGNLAVKKSVFENLGAFRTDLGRKGNGLRSCEETEFALRFFRSGGSAVYEPEAIVHHAVDSRRLTKSYVRRQAYWDGWSHANFEKDYGMGTMAGDVESFLRLVLHSVMHMKFSLSRQAELCRRGGRLVNRVFVPRLTSKTVLASQ